MTTPDTFLAIDPGLAAVGGSGWALVNGRDVVGCGVLRNAKEWKSLASRMRGQKAALGAVVPVLSEWMQIRHGNIKGDPQDLVDLNALSGHLGTHFVTPTQWKGSTPRLVEQARTLAALTSVERELITTEMNAVPKGVRKEILSAVGIALSALRRAHRKCGWPHE